MIDRAMTVKRWYAIHKWSSLICTIFLFVFCLTGLPLIFADELNDWFGSSPAYADLPSDTPPKSLDAIVEIAKAKYPGRLVRTVTIDDDEPAVLVETVAPPVNGAASNGSLWTRFDARTGDVIEEVHGNLPPVKAFIQFLYRVHTDLFAGLPGKLFLGFVGALFVVATATGVALYGPFMRNIPFGSMRQERSQRIRWLDTHNLLGIVTVVWTVVVGVTGVLNEIASPLFDHWQQTTVLPATRYKSSEPAWDPSQPSSPQAVADTVRAALPGNYVYAILYPGGRFGSPRDYFVLSKGNTPLTSKLYKPALVNATTGKITAIVDMPWYLRSIEVSRPLHFGNYGGLPLKIIWAVLDIATLFVLATGLYLWLARRRQMSDRYKLLAMRDEARAA